MSDFKVEDRDYDLWLLLARTHYRVKQARTSELRRFDLTPEQAGILYYVNASGNNAMPTEISRWMMREPQTITSIIDHMEKKGLIKKSHDDERKNVIRISLTDKGRRVLEHSSQRESFHKIMSALTDEKRESLREILNDLRESARRLQPRSENDPEE
jgi:MarR family 2-MHQ and catechol resistance regulon transcriptional repressor